MTRQRRRGQSLVEFTFVGIPLIFVLISIFEMSRGMWIYHTLANSVKAGVRYTIVHGVNCKTITGVTTNACQVHLSDIGRIIQYNAVGLDTTDTTLTFTSTYSSGAPAGVAVGPCTIADTVAGSCNGDPIWPPDDTVSDLVGAKVTINIVTQFRSMISLFWPGARVVQFGLAKLPAASSDYIQF